MWATEAAGFISKLKERSLHSTSLVSTDFRLNLLMGTGDLSRAAEPTGIFEFNISNSTGLAIADPAPSAVRNSINLIVINCLSVNLQRPVLVLLFFSVFLCCFNYTLGCKFWIQHRRKWNRKAERGIQSCAVIRFSLSTWSRATPAWLTRWFFLNCFKILNNAGYSLNYFSSLRYFYMEH